MNSTEQLQDEREQHNLNELSDFQKEVVAMLKSIGYKYKYNKVYQLTDLSNAINVDNINTLKDIFTLSYKNGAQDKIWEIKNLLQIV